jgi:hypothetical protein
VRRMFGMMATGSSLKGVCKTLDGEGVPTPGNSPYWNPITVRRTLLKDLYLPHTADELLKLAWLTRWCETWTRTRATGYGGSGRPG